MYSEQQNSFSFPFTPQAISLHNHTPSQLLNPVASISEMSPESIPSSPFLLSQHQLKLSCLLSEHLIHHLPRVNQTARLRVSYSRLTSQPMASDPHLQEIRVQPQLEEQVHARSSSLLTPTASSQIILTFDNLLENSQNSWKPMVLLVPFMTWKRTQIRTSQRKRHRAEYGRIPKVKLQLFSEHWQHHCVTIHMEYCQLRKLILCQPECPVFILGLYYKGMFKCPHGWTPFPLRLVLASVSSLISLFHTIHQTNCFPQQSCFIMFPCFCTHWSLSAWSPFVLTTHSFFFVF